MPERKEKADGDRPLALLHQLACHIVDRRQMVRIDGVTKSKAVRQHRGPDQDRLMDERHQCPDPGRQIGENENGINCNDPTAKAEQFGFCIGRIDFTSAPWRPSLCQTSPIMSPQRKDRPMRAHRTPEG